MTTAKRRVLAVVLAVALLGGAVGGTAWYRYAHRQVLVVVDPACPPLLTNTWNATDDYGDVVEWDGRTWWRSEDPTTADVEQVGVVGCVVGEMPNEQGLSVAPGRWPDGTATVLARGTTLHLPREDRADEALVARTAEGDVLYCLVDDQPGPPSC